MKNVFHKLTYVFFVVVLFLIASCKFNDSEKDGLEEEAVSEQSPASMEEEISAKNDPIKVVTKSMEFITQDEMPSGWISIQYENDSNDPHFLTMEKYPEGKGIKDSEKDLIPVFDEGMRLLIEGKNDEAMAEFGNLPEWYQKVEFYGGVGLTSPNTTSQATFKVVPGTYIIECYVKMPNGTFHSSNGMAKEIHVTDRASGMDAPDADYEIHISSEEGIQFDGNVSPGEHTFAVHYDDQKVHENFVWHDVHLVWAEPDADLSKLNDWMNWTAPTGLQTPAPGGFKFMGGIGEMAAGKTGYFTADLKPGKYVLISEVADPKGNEMLKTFTVK